MIAALGPVDGAAGVAHHDERLDLGTAAQGFVDVGFQRYRLAAPAAFVGANHHPAAGVVDPVLEGFGGKAAEHHAVHRADAGAGEHGHRAFRNHRQVQADAVAPSNALVLEHIGKAADRLMEFAVGELALLAGFIAFPEYGDAVAVIG